MEMVMIIVREEGAFRYEYRLIAVHGPSTHDFPPFPFCPSMSLSTSTIS
jgi:hypothetical protein